MLHLASVHSYFDGSNVSSIIARLTRLSYAVATLFFVSASVSISATSASSFTTMTVPHGIVFETDMSPDECRHSTIVWFSFSEETTDPFGARPLSAAGLTSEKTSRLVWVSILRFAGQALLGYTTGEILDRTVVGDYIDYAIDNLSDLVSVSMDERTKEDVRDLRRAFEDALVELRDANMTHAQRRQAILSALDGQGLNRARLRLKIRSLDQRLYEMEKEQQRQLRMIVDNQGRIRSLEGRIVNMEGELVALNERVSRAETRTAVNEKAIRKTEDRVDANERDIDAIKLRVYAQRIPMYISVGGTYLSALDYKGGQHLGIESSIQINPSNHVGVIIGYNFSPISAVDAPFAVEEIDGLPVLNSTKVFWHTHFPYVGINVEILEPYSPVSLQVGTHAGLMIGSLRATEEDNIFAPETSSKIGSFTSPAATGRAEMAFGRNTWFGKPFISVSYTGMLNEMAVGSSVNAGKYLWSGSFGVRILFPDEEATP